MSKTTWTLAGTTAAVMSGAAAVCVGETWWAFKTVGRRVNATPYTDTTWNKHLPGTALRIAFAGDSLAAGIGATDPTHTCAYLVGQGIAKQHRRPVRLTNVATPGARTRDLAQQVDQLLHIRPHIAVIIIGANDITRDVRYHKTINQLCEAVTRLEHVGCRVLVGTCPDMSCSRALLPPLRQMASGLCACFANAQANAVLRAHGTPIALRDLTAAFASNPGLFAADHYHPSDAGHHVAADLLLNPVLTALRRQFGCKDVVRYQRNAA